MPKIIRRIFSGKKITKHKEKIIESYQMFKKKNKVLFQSSVFWFVKINEITTLCLPLLSTDSNFSHFILTLLTLLTYKN